MNKDYFIKIEKKMVQTRGEWKRPRSRKSQKNIRNWNGY